jgi:hypothetical protein
LYHVILGLITPRVYSELFIDITYTPSQIGSTTMTTLTAERYVTWF